MDNLRIFIDGIEGIDLDIEMSRIVLTIGKVSKSLRNHLIHKKMIEPSLNTIAQYNFVVYQNMIRDVLITDVRSFCALYETIIIFSNVTNLPIYLTRILEKIVETYDIIYAELYESKAHFTEVMDKILSLQNYMRQSSNITFELEK